ncbi:hypothetical protein WT59_02925 [Burkholderia territorii]|nr:hypothetical protein WT59_02925 [Burkholderia territorii]
MLKMERVLRNMMVRRLGLDDERAEAREIEILQYIKIESFDIDGQIQRSLATELALNQRIDPDRGDVDYFAFADAPPIPLEYEPSIERT